MNLLFVLNIGFDKGGPSVHLLKSVIEAALSKGHSCHVVLKKTNDEKETGLEEISVRYPSLTVSLVRNIYKGKSGFIKRYLQDCRYALRCKKEYKGKRYDAVFLQSCNVGWVFMKGFKALKCPVIFNIQDIFPQNLMFSGQLPVAKLTYPLFSRLQKAAYKRATRLITISEDMKKTLTEQGIDGDKIEVVYNWSYGDSPIFSEEIPAERFFDLNADPKKTNVVYAGNIGKMQNVEIVARAAALSKNDEEVHYYIIGDGANKSRICEITHGLDNVTLLPMQPAKYAESIYAQADINIIPLAKGGIKTSLPSKTATVLRTKTHTVFCIDEGSRFEESIGHVRNVHFASNSDENLLYQKILDIRKSGAKPVSEELPSRFSVNNAEKYVEIMENTAREQRDRQADN